MEREVETKAINLIGSNAGEECEAHLGRREEAAGGRMIDRPRETSSRKRTSNVRGAAPKP